MCLRQLATMALLLLLLATIVLAAPTISTKITTPQRVNRVPLKIENTATTAAATSPGGNTSGPTASTTAMFHLQWTPRAAWKAAAPLHAPTAITRTGAVTKRAGEADEGAFTSDSTAGVSHVIIHHTATPADACRRNANACAETVRAIQRTHQQQRGWDDIGYNFLIGGSDERAEIYEGRGFNVVGAHAVGYNARSIGIALIGDWTVSLPPRPVLEKLKQLIAYGVEMGFIQRDYKLLGHRQVKATACPGTQLFDQLKAWPHFTQQ